MISLSLPKKSSAGRLLQRAAKGWPVTSLRFYFLGNVGFYPSARFFSAACSFRRDSINLSDLAKSMYLAHTLRSFINISALEKGQPCEESRS